MYKIDQNKQIVVTDSKNKKHTFIVPLNFEVNDETIGDLMNSDKELLKCEEWLKNKGFEKEERGWSIYSDNKKSIRLPQFFIDFEKKDLRVKFHKIIGLNTFIIPVIKIGNIGAKYFNYSSMNNFPDCIKINQYFHLSNSLSNNIRDVYADLVTTYFFLDNPKISIDNKICLELIKNNKIEELKQLKKN